MFYVQGISGQSFRGPLEQLVQVSAVQAARRARAIATEGEELGAEIGVSGPSDTGEPQRYAQAAAAYAKMFHPETDRGKRVAEPPVMFA